MATITLNYRGRQAKYQYDIADNLEVDIKFKKSRDLCRGSVNGQAFQFAWFDFGGGESLADWSNDKHGAPIDTPYFPYLCETICSFFETNKNL